MGVPDFPDQVSGFTVVPVVISPPGEDKVYHTLYMKKHEVRHNSKNAGAADDDDDEEDEATRTVFVVNAPVTTTYDHIKNLCQSIAGVLVEDYKPDIRNTGKIILVDKASALRLVSKAKQVHKLEKPLTWTSKTAVYGHKSMYYLHLKLDECLLTMIRIRCAKHAKIP